VSAALLLLRATRHASPLIVQLPLRQPRAEPAPQPPQQAPEPISEPVESERQSAYDRNLINSVTEQARKDPEMVAHLLRAWLMGE